MTPLDDILDWKNRSITRKLPPWQKIPTSDGWEAIYLLGALKAEMKLDSDEEVTVFVHGTFAAAKSIKGSGWWQSEGSLTKKLTEEQGRHVISFHWSGANSDYARRQAGIRLWVFLCQLEYIGVKYSIVAHSHGGMVVWNALAYSTIWHGEGSARSRGLTNKLVPGFPAEVREYLEMVGSLPAPRGLPFSVPPSNDLETSRLPGLVKWITVGTPYLSLGIKRRHFRKLPFLLGIFSFIPAIFLANSYPVSSTIILFLIFFIAILTNKAEIKRQLSESFANAAKDVTRAFGGRHLAIWSKSDEAISGLKATLKADGKLVPRFRSRSDDSKKTRIQNWFIMDNFGELSDDWAIARFQLQLKKTRAWITGGLYWFFGDLCILPLVDFVLRKRLRRTMFGEDLADVYCAGVSEFPDPEIRFLEIEESGIDLEGFLRKSDTNLAEIGRVVLSQASLSGIAALRNANYDDVFDILVHNNYFNHPEVVELVLDVLNET